MAVDARFADGHPALLRRGKVRYAAGCFDDQLLQPGDYQIAPAGTAHGGLCTDTGVLLFAHGDLDLDVTAS